MNLFWSFWAVFYNNTKWRRTLVRGKIANHRIWKQNSMRAELKCLTKIKNKNETLWLSCNFFDFFLPFHTGSNSSCKISHPMVKKRIYQHFLHSYHHISDLSLSCHFSISNHQQGKEQEKEQHSRFVSNDHEFTFLIISWFIFWTHYFLIPF